MYRGTIPYKAWFGTRKVYAQHYNGEWSINPRVVWLPDTPYLSLPFSSFKPAVQQEITNIMRTRPDWTHNKNKFIPVGDRSGSISQEAIDKFVEGCKKITKQDIEQPCVCSMDALWDGGCPSNRGNRCKSK